MRNWVGSVATVGLVAMTPRLVGAEPAPARVELRWNAPSECPDSLGLARGIEGFLGQPLADAREQVAISGHVLGDAQRGFAAKLVFSGSQGRFERSLEHPDCSKLSEAVALLAALAIDPERVRARQEAQQTSQTSPEPAPQQDEVAKAPSSGPPPTPIPSESMVAPTPSERHRVPMPAKQPSLRPLVAVLGLAGGGSLPSAAPGVALELGGRFRRLEAAVIGRAWAGRTASVPQSATATVEVSLLTAGLRLCTLPNQARWSFLACVRGDLGIMSARGEQVDDARGRNDWFNGLGGGLGVAYEIGRFSPRAGGELLWSPSRPRFGVLRDQLGVEAFRPKSWQLIGFLGLAYVL